MLVREMDLEETDFVIRYFHDSSPEHLSLLGVDPARLPSAETWREFYTKEYALAIEHRTTTLLIWLIDGTPIGFSTADKITFGSQASMHLHIVDPTLRGRGVGVEGVLRSAAIYFDRLRIERLYCEPNAFNTAPNRTLQKAGFSYLKTYTTVPGPLNFHQPVTRWLLTREQVASESTAVD